MSSTRHPIAPWDRLMALGLPDGFRAQALALRQMGFTVGKIAHLTGNSRRAVRRYLYEAQRRIPATRSSTTPGGREPPPVFLQLLRRAIADLGHPGVLLTDQACALPRQLITAFLADLPATSTDEAAPCPCRGADPAVR